MDAATVRKRRWAKLWKSPMTWLPTIGGLAALVLSGGSGPLAIVGAAGIVIGVGSVVWKLTGGSQKLNDATLAELRREAYEQHLDEIRGLQQKLRTDKDSRTGQAVRDLRDLYKRMYRADLLADSDGPAWQYDIRQQIAEGYHSALTSLRRTYDLWQTAEEMQTDEKREEMLLARNEVIAEVNQTISQLTAAVDTIQSKSARQQIDDEQLSTVRQQLEQGLEVARRVEQRMTELEASVDARVRE